MLGYVAIVHIYLWIFFVFSFKARRGLQRVQDKIVPDKTLRRLTSRGVRYFNFRLRAVLAWVECAESLISRISSRKRIFKQHHFSLFIRGPDGFDSWNKKWQTSRDTDLKRTGSSAREDRVQFLKVTGIYFSLKSLKQSQIQRLPVFVMFL